MHADMPTVDAYFLPELIDEDVEAWGTRAVTDGDAPFMLRWPRLTPAGAHRIARALRDSRDALRARDVADIITAIDAAVEHMRADRLSWDLLVTRIAAVTGYSSEMARHVMDRMSEDWRSGALHNLVLSEIGDASVLDSFAHNRAQHASHPSHAKSVKAIGPALSFHIFAGNVPGVAVTSIIRALLVKAPVLGKAASGEPLFAVAFARALAHVEPDIARSLAVTYWAGGSEEIEATIFDIADCVIHYGGNASLDDVRRRLPDHVRLLDHGPRISFGMIAAEAIAHDDDAKRLAVDVAFATAMFDQQGCVSPHLIFVQDGGSGDVRTFASRVAVELRRFEADLPRGRLTAADASAIRRVRDTAEFQAIAGRSIDVFGPDDLAFTVIHDTTPAFAASCLNRTLTVHPVSSFDEVLPLIRPYGSVLQSVAIAASPAHVRRIAEPLTAAGVTRITSFSSLPFPPPAWHHDGRGPLTELLRFADLEP